MIKVSTLATIVTIYIISLQGNHVFSRIKNNEQITFINNLHLNLSGLVCYSLILFATRNEIIPNCLISENLFRRHFVRLKVLWTAQNISTFIHNSGSNFEFGQNVTSISCLAIRCQQREKSCSAAKPSIWLFSTTEWYFQAPVSGHWLVVCRRDERKFCLNLDKIDGPSLRGVKPCSSK